MNFEDENTEESINESVILLKKAMLNKKKQPKKLIERS